jgi:oligoribonuclease (3'-5' exoribonuclease)
MLVWTDIESTGLDERLDHVLEVGLAVTSREYPFEVEAQTNVVLGWPTEPTRKSYRILRKPVTTPARDREWCLQRMAQSPAGEDGRPVVLAMHSDNGLIADVEQSTMTVEQGERYLLHWLREHGVKPGRAFMAGSGIAAFDRRFLNHHMPDLNGYLHYGNIDVGVIRRTLEMLGRDDVVAMNSNKGVGNAVTDLGAKDRRITHRGLADALDHLEEFRAYARFLLEAPVLFYPGDPHG